MTVHLPARRDRRSGIVIASSPGTPHLVLYDHLLCHGVRCSLCSGGLRFAPHYLTADSGSRELDYLGSIQYVLRRRDRSGFWTAIFLFALSAALLTVATVSVATGYTSVAGVWDFLVFGLLMAAGGIFVLRDRTAIAGQVLMAAGDAGIYLAEPAQCIPWARGRGPGSRSRRRTSSARASACSASRRAARTTPGRLANTNMISFASHDTLAAHWDGTAWTIVPTSAAASGGRLASLYGVTDLGPTDTWAAGQGKDARGYFSATDAAATAFISHHTP